MKRLAGLVMLLALVVALPLQSQDAMKKVTIKNLYTMSIPATMVESNSLNDIASLQYNAPEKELYVIVIDESLKELSDSNLKLNLPIYFKMASFNIATGLKDFNIDNMKNFSIGTAKVMQGEFTGYLKNNNVGIYYLAAVIETPRNYYQIFAWTLREQADTYRKVFQDMINSFREL